MAMQQYQGQPGYNVTQTSNPWSSTWGCCSDPCGCLMMCCFPCSCCAICEVGELIGSPQSVEFTNCCSQCINALTWVNFGWIPVGGLFGLCCCPDKTWCCYTSHILDMAIAKMGKQGHPGPCGDSSCECGARWYWQMCCPCTGPCTMCLIHRELKEYARTHPYDNTMVGDSNLTAPPQGGFQKGPGGQA